MYRNCKLILFIFFLTLLFFKSYAKEGLYIVDKGTNTIKVCERTGNKCSGIPLHDEEIRPNAIAISRDGLTFVMSAEDNHLHICFRDRSSNLFYNCFQNSYVFDNPQGMTFDGYGRLLVTNKNDGSIISCTNINSRDAYSCKREVTLQGPNSIVVSNDNNYVYITQPDDGSFVICTIDHAHENSITQCNHHYYRGIMQKPIGIAIDHTNRYLLIVDQDPLAAKKFQNTISCLLNEGGRSVSICNAWITGGLNKQVQNPTTSIVTIEPAPGSQTAVIGTKTRLYICQILDDGSYSCHQNTKKYENLYSIAYISI